MKDSKSILSISYDDIRIKAEEMGIDLTEGQMEEIFDRFDANDVMMESFWLLLEEMINEKADEEKEQ